jgi:hypothetical protein
MHWGNLLLQVSTAVRALLGLKEDSTTRQLALNVKALHRVKVEAPSDSEQRLFLSLVPSPSYHKDHIFSLSSSTLVCSCYDMSEMVKQGGRKWLRRRDITKTVFCKEPEHSSKIRTDDLLDECARP